MPALRASWAGPVIGLLLVLIAAPLGHVTAQPCPPCLRAGAASVPLNPPAGTPLAGYGSFRRRLLFPDVLGRYPHAFWFKPSEGDLDPLVVRALVIESAGARLIWVTADLVAVNREFTATVADHLRAAGVPAGTLMISASHTHSGPGAFGHSTLWALWAADRFDAAVQASLLDAIVEAVRRAEVAKGPARASSFSLMAPPVTEGRLGLSVDREIVGLRITRRDGGGIALVWNFAIHGTMLSAGNLRFSGDVMGVANRALERDLGIPALYINGAVGDVQPQRHGPEAVLAVGAELAAAVRAGWARSPTPRDAGLTIGQGRVTLGAASISARNCLGKWVPGAVTLPLGQALPDDAELVGVALGDTAWVSIPGELQSALGERVKASARPRFAHAFVAGVTNDYLAYFVTRRAYAWPTYVTCGSLYGREAGERLTEAAVGLVKSLGGKEHTGHAPSAARDEERR